MVPLADLNAESYKSRTQMKSRLADFLANLLGLPPFRAVYGCCL